MPPRRSPRSPRIASRCWSDPAVGSTAFKQVAWVESASPSFRARHESTHADDVDRVLYSLERTREHLAVHFPRTVDGMSVVFHSGVVSLSIACPMVPLTWIAAAPAARRYIAGWSGRDELHIVRPDVLEARGSSVPGSREMLATTASALYARRVIIENNPDVPLRPTPRRIRAELRWAWLIEGAARWFGGQTAHARPAIARRLREGRRPAFPPGVRDAPLLGGHGDRSARARARRGSRRPPRLSAAPARKASRAAGGIRQPARRPRSRRRGAPTSRGWPPHA